LPLPYERCRWDSQSQIEIESLSTQFPEMYTWHTTNFHFFSPIKLLSTYFLYSFEMTASSESKGKVFCSPTLTSSNEQVFCKQ
jgi:hypothetical protein